MGDNDVDVGIASFVVETCVKGCVQRIEMYDVLHVKFQLLCKLVCCEKTHFEDLRLHLNMLGCAVRAR